MNYVIDKDGETPAYMQLYAQLRADILAGALPFGAKLPSKRTLAEELGLSLITVEHALALLADEGYVETRQRSGIFVAFGGLRHTEEAPVLPVPRLLPTQRPRTSPSRPSREPCGGC